MALSLLFGFEKKQFYLGRGFRRGLPTGVRARRGGVAVARVLSHGPRSFVCVFDNSALMAARLFVCLL